MTIRLFVVDDHAIVRRGIVQVLCEHPEVQIIAEASDYAGLRNELKKHGEPDVLVMDVGLPGKNGIDILKVLRDEHPQTEGADRQHVSRRSIRRARLSRGCVWISEQGECAGETVGGTGAGGFRAQVRHTRNRTGVD